MTHHNLFRKGFETQAEEISVDDLSVEGTLPDWLEGTYVRNGPGRFDLEHARYWHWFDGLAMPHRYTFTNGKASFANRYLHTSNYNADTKTQTLNYRMPATDPKRTWIQKLFSPFDMKFTDNTNIHTIELDGEYVALTERVKSWAFDLQTLETKEVFKYDDNIGEVMQTGHPHYDPKTKTIYNYMLRFGPRCVYEVYSLRGRKHKLIKRIPVWTPSYMHSFGMTENYIVLTEYPMKMTPFALMQFMFTDTPFFENFSWNPQLGTIFTVISKATGDIVKQVQSDAFFCWHHINAFEDGNDVVVDVSAYADSSIVQGLYVETMKSDVEFSTMTAEYRRYRIPLFSASTLATVEYDLAADERIILPRINYNHYNAKPYRYSYGVSTHSDIRDFVNELVKIDTKDAAGVINRWYVEGHYPSEPVFAPRPNATEEDEGVVMTTVYDTTADVSYLLILDGQSFTQMAKVVLPLRIPFGFHGRWYPNGNMYAT